MAGERYFSTGFVVVVVHVVVIGGLLMWTAIGGCLFKKAPVEIVPFTVAIDPVGEPDVPEPEKIEPEPEVKEQPKSDDVPAVEQKKEKPKPPPPKEKPKPKPTPPKEKPKPKPRPQMTKGRRVNTRTLPRPAFDPKEKQRLSDKEIAEMLKRGARIGPTTSIPKDDLSMNFSILKRELTRAWLRPSRENEGYRPAEVKFSLGPGGRISNPVLVTSSGNRVFDDSVLSAVKSVVRVDGLTPQFIKAYPELVIDFSFED